MTIPELERIMAGHAPRLQGVEREYAVLVPVAQREGRPHLLFEVRAETLSRQPGEVCFPGGRMEAGEGPADCALRETWEELNIPPSAVRVAALLDPICHQGGFLMHPVLGVVEPGAAEALIPSPAEVKEAFWVPLDFFLERPPARYGYDLIPDVKEDFPYGAIGFPRGYAWKGGRVDVPVYLWEGKAIWGLTGRIVDNLAGYLK